MRRKKAAPSTNPENSETNPDLLQSGNRKPAPQCSPRLSVSETVVLFLRNTHLLIVSPDSWADLARRQAEPTYRSVQILEAGSSLRFIIVYCPVASEHDSKTASPILNFLSEEMRRLNQELFCARIDAS
jgi:hypothetical protein